MNFSNLFYLITNKYFEELTYALNLIKWLHVVLPKHKKFKIF